MPIHSQHSISLIGGGGGGQSKFTLIELLVVMLVLGILMAIAIPLIGGVREAANNAKCRSNLKQLHTAIFAFSTSNKELLPNLQSDLTPLIDGGYIESESKLGICPGAGNKPKLPLSSYKGGQYLDGTKKLSSAGINSETIILEDAQTSHHKAGKNAIRLDGSFSQSGGDRKSEQEVINNLFDVVDKARMTGDTDEIDAVLSRGGDVNTLIVRYGNEHILCYLVDWYGDEDGIFDDPLLATIRYLVNRHGANPNIVGAYDLTAIELAAGDYPSAAGLAAALRGK